MVFRGPLREGPFWEPCEPQKIDIGIAPSVESHADAHVNLAVFTDFSAYVFVRFSCPIVARGHYPASDNQKIFSVYHNPWS